MRLDLLIASASAGLLVYSGRLLAPSARLSPDDIIANLQVPAEPSMAAPWPVFPADDAQVAIRKVLDDKIGFDLLAYGTIGSVLTVIAGAVSLSWGVPETMEVVSPLVAGVLGYGAGWWWTERSGWYLKRERRLRLGPKYRDAGLLFCGPTGRPLNPSNLRNRDHLPRIKRLGLPRTRPHDLRHLHATELAAAGVDGAIVAARLGHHNAAFTLRRYVHPRLKDQARAAEVANALLGRC